MDDADEDERGRENAERRNDSSRHISKNVANKGRRREYLPGREPTNRNGVGAITLGQPASGIDEAPCKNAIKS